MTQNICVIRNIFIYFLTIFFVPKDMIGLKRSNLGDFRKSSVDVGLVVILICQGLGFGNMPHIQPVLKLLRLKNTRVYSPWMISFKYPSLFILNCKNSQRYHWRIIIYLVFKWKNIYICIWLNCKLNFIFKKKQFI